MQASGEGFIPYEVRRTVHDRVSNRDLIAAAQRAVSRARELCEESHETRRRADSYYHRAKCANMSPKMRRFLPLCGGAADPLRIETEERPEGIILHISGEVDLVNGNRFREAIRPAVANCRNVVLDWSALRYIDSTGFHVVIDAQRALHRHGCHLIVVGASPEIVKVMRVLHLDPAIPLSSSVDEALERIRATFGSAASDA